MNPFSLCCLHRLASCAVSRLQIECRRAYRIHLTNIHAAPGGKVRPHRHETVAQQQGQKLSPTQPRNQKVCRPGFRDTWKKRREKKTRNKPNTEDEKSKKSQVFANAVHVALQVKSESDERWRDAATIVEGNTPEVCAIFVHHYIIYHKGSSCCRLVSVDPNRLLSSAPTANR